MSEQQVPFTPDKLREVIYGDAETRGLLGRIVRVTLLNDDEAIGLCGEMRAPEEFHDLDLILARPRPTENGSRPLKFARRIPVDKISDIKPVP